MAGDVGERFLGDAIQHNSSVTGHLLHRSKGRQADPDARLSPEVFHKRVEGGNQPQVIQHRRAQIPGKLMHDIHCLLHQPLRADDASLQAPGVTRGLLFQTCQAHIDARQRLGDDIMQFAADLLSLFLLHRQKLAGKQPQLILHLPRLLQQLTIVLLAIPEGFLRRLPLVNLPPQLPVRDRQSLYAALRLLRLLQGRDVRNCHPAPFRRTTDGNGRGAVKAGPERRLALS